MNTGVSSYGSWYSKQSFHIDGLVINAGGPAPGFFEEFDDQAWQAAFELTLMSAIRLIRATLPALKVNGGSILTLTSSAVKEPIDILVMSNVMRSGVNSLVKTLATDLAQYNILIQSNTSLQALNSLIFSLCRVTRNQGGK
ncbi:MULTISPECIES: SDR family NAD(P)-dependent oxidoreductase [unclassified Endozoicomonas]|uniref:SDR family NAD(P)-dependent oxidoreductase n=1 Tax=unclassified Endozoicomonas TaxID=2644528 RepID=UPI003BB56A2F